MVSALPTSWGDLCRKVAPDPGTLHDGGCFVSDNSVMVPSKAGTYGTIMFRDAGFRNVDFSVFKTASVKERYNATFRAEFFNFFNHPSSPIHSAL